MLFVDFDAVLRGEVAGNVPGVHLHAQEFHIVFIYAVAEAGVAQLVEEGEAPVVGVDAAGINGDGARVGGPHEVFTRNECLVGKILQKIHAHPRYRSSRNYRLWG